MLQWLVKTKNLSIIFDVIEVDVLKCTITDNGIGRQKFKNETHNIDRSHSTGITETRLGLYNQPPSSDKFKIVYTDFVEEENMSGLKVEIYLPMSYSFAKD